MLLDQSISSHTHSRHDVQIRTLNQGNCIEYFITVLPQPSEDARTLFTKAAETIRSLEAVIISQDVFGLPHEKNQENQAFREAFGDITWPVTWVNGLTPDSTFGTTLWAVSGIEVQPVHGEDRVIGTVFQIGQTRFCRLGDLRPATPRGSNAAQTEAVFVMMDQALRQIGMDFSHVIRTWFFNDDILAWYGEFNQVRTHFFKTHHVFEGLVPASTGIGGRNPAGTALVSGLLATQPCTGEVQIRAVPSPLQCPALDYGSSFSRAVEIETPSLRRLWISGTASIDLDGSTIYTGDMTKQIEWTMEVVAAILHSRHMTWNDVVRGVVYIRNQADLPLYSRWAQVSHLPAMPVVITQNRICRDDLLFEIELDAVSANTR